MAKRLGYFDYYDGCYYREYWYTSKGVYMRGGGVVNCCEFQPVRCSANEYHQNLSRLKSGKVSATYRGYEVSPILDNGDITPS